ncbi:MAG: cell division topological specificity factor MinE [Firmicutes bacterium]|nr:cell division topological specificity factor MinE [Bacillota bacterium]
MDWLKFINPREEPSKDVAKERLRLLLIHDRASVAPQLLESLRGDLIAAITKYMDIDESGMEVNLENVGHSVVLMANIPIRRVKRGVQASL